MMNQISKYVCIALFSLLFPEEGLAQIVNPFSASDQDAALSEINKSQRMMEDGYYEEALNLLEKIERKDDVVNKQYQLLYASIWEKLGYFDQALEALKKLNAEYLDDSDVDSALANYYFRQTSYNEAIQYFEEVLLKSPEGVMPVYLLFLCQLLTGEPERIEIPELFMDFSREHPGYFFARAVKAFASGEQQKGLYFMQGAIQLFPPSDSLIMIRPLLQTGWVHSEEIFLREHTASQQ